MPSADIMITILEKLTKLEQDIDIILERLGNPQQVPGNPSPPGAHECAIELSGQTQWVTAINPQNIQEYTFTYPNEAEARLAVARQRLQALMDQPPGTVTGDAVMEQLQALANEDT